MGSLQLACVCATLASTLGFRIVRTGTVVEVVCTYEHLAVIFDEDESEKRGEKETEVGECIAEDGAVYAVDPYQIEWAVHGDVLSLRLRSQPGVTAPALGTPMFTILHADLLHHETQNESLTLQASGRSVAAVGTSWRDGSTSAQRSSVRSNFETAQRWINQSSYNSFRFSSWAWLSASVPQRWGNLVTECRARDIQRAVSDSNPDSMKYMYRMLFLPNEPRGCGWAGIAQVGCGRPSNPARAGACWSMYRNERAFVQAHELGHNFGLLHAGGERRGQYLEYGDPQAIMGNSFTDATAAFSAAARFSLGWLRDRAGEVRTATSGRFILSVLTSGRNFNGADAVAVKFGCSACVPKVDQHKDRVGGEIFISFGYGSVMVHLSRASGRGTEHWAALAAGQGWRNPHGRNAVHVCRVRSSLATVAIDATPSAARNRCR
jgi:hypothetical protein